ncbi:ParB/RepB/Spo0J family partition protein [Algicola sagamiensis]|uniref:ParB/RepB/Spo0J family partition protein n=1 Tax=Algicola sagamiensis TaxID=163869 RepID=UPI00035CFD1E|nr:ParB/RepB/Spo0J family partition protein [Algicola sagamiensis]
MSKRNRGLGRGLDALLTSSHPPKSTTNELKVEAENTVPSDGALKTIPVEFLEPGAYQPRKDMSAEALDELAGSIQAQGIIQPIVVRQLANEKYEIIAGERRWRASQMAGLDEVPCLIREVADHAAIAIALIENIQREDLNAMEEAVALSRLMNEFSLTHQQVAESVGKSRTTVTNLLRLNQLNEDVKKLLEHGDLEMGHARALLSLEGPLQSEAAAQVVAKALTVRETEKLVKRLQQPLKEVVEKIKDPDVQLLEQQLSESIGSNVRIQYNDSGKGKLVISYASLDELDGIVSRINPLESEDIPA